MFHCHAQAMHEAAIANFIAIEASFLTHSLRSKAKQWMSFCGYGQNGVSKICVDGCDVVSENSGSDVTNWLDLNNR